MSTACKILSPGVLALWFGLWALAPGEAPAAGFAISEQSPKAGGTGGAGVARCSDPAAAWYNPAALADGQGWRASVGLLLAFPMIQAEALNGRWAALTDSSSPSTPPHAYLSYAWGPLAAGISFNVPFGSSVRWPEQWMGRFETVSSSLQVFRLAPFFSWRFARVRISGGLHVDIANLQVRKALDFVDQQGKVALDLSDVGFGGHTAVFVDAAPWLSLGATYKSRTGLDLEGIARFDAPTAFSTRAHDQRAAAAYTLPDLITVGGRLRPHPRWSILLDLGVAVWSVYEELFIDFEDDNTTDVRQQNRWETQVFVRGGAQFLVLPWLAARAGIFYDPTPVPEDTLAPNSPDSDRLGFSAGAGFNLPWGFSLDLFYTHVLFLGQPSTNNENLQASYGGNLHMLGVGVGWRSAD